MPDIGLDTFVVSDTHFYHDNIVRYCDRAQQIRALSGRDIHHNAYMVKCWNSVVGPDDLVLHLGDLYYWRKDAGQRFAKEIAPRLNGHKLLILGNHDKDTPAVYASTGFPVIEPFETEIGGVKVSFDHYPAAYNPLRECWHIHGHIHNHGSAKPKQINVSVEAIDYTPRTLGSLLPWT